MYELCSAGIFDAFTKKHPQAAPISGCHRKMGQFTGVWTDSQGNASGRRGDNFCRIEDGADNGRVIQLPRTAGSPAPGMD
eukprot:5956766-Pyramimonas_sp.AAC.1